MYILFGYHGTLRESKHSKVITNSTRNAWALVYYRGARDGVIGQLVQKSNTL